MTTGMERDPANDNTPPPELNWFFKFMLLIAGTNADVLTTHCPEDIPKVLAQAGLLVATWLYSSVVLTMIFNSLFAAEHFSFGLMLGAIGVSMLVSTCDAYVFLHCSWVKAGISELKKVGWDIPLPLTQRLATNLFLLNRLMLAGAFAYVVGLCMSLIIYSGDIRDRLDAAYMKANASIIIQVRRPYDDEIKSERDLVANEESVVKASSKQATALRQSQANSIARGGKKRRDEPAIQNGVRAFDTKLTDETAKLDKMKARLADLVQGLNGKVRTAVDSAPNHVSYNGGLLSMVKILEDIKSENGEIAFIVDAIEVIAVGIEMAAVLAKLLGFNPTGYSAIIAKLYYQRLSQVAADLERELGNADDISSEPPEEQPMNDHNPFTELDVPANDNGMPQQPIKRGRGRPKGSKTRWRFTNGSGQDTPKE